LQRKIATPPADLGLSLPPEGHLKTTIRSRAAMIAVAGLITARVRSKIAVSGEHAKRGCAFSPPEAG
jgi:hypothetical protein